MTESTASKSTVLSATAAAHPAVFFDDLAEGLRMSEVWRAFAWDETQQRYKRSVLGVLWIVVSYAFFVGTISFFFVGFSSLGASHFVTYVALGFAVFQLLVGNIIDGCQVFSSSANWIKSTAMPYSIYVYKSISRSLFPFALQFCVALVLMVSLGWRPSWLALLAIPALAVFILYAVALQYFLGLVAARYRDINHLTGTITRVLIFMTPILWVREESTGVRALLADINPLTHFLEIFRNPLMGAEPRLLSWGVVLGVTAAFWLAAAVASVFMRRRLPFWI